MKRLDDCDEYLVTDVSAASSNQHTYQSGIGVTCGISAGKEYFRSGKLSIFGHTLTFV